MFWGLIMEPGRRYSQKVNKSFRITMAAIDLSTCEKEPCQVMCSYEGRNYLLCTLRKPDLLQCSLDLEFTSGTEVSFASNGNAHIHLTGYLIESDGDGLTLADLEEQEEEEYVEEEEATEKSNKKKRPKKKTDEEPPSKKAKLLNGSLEEEEEESDDPDYEEAEAEGGEEESSDEGEEEGEEEEDGEDEESEDDEDVQVEVEKRSKKQSKGETKINGDQKKDKKGLQQKKQKKTLEKGVVIEDLVEGSGSMAKPGRFINVYYEGRLEKNNKVFDSMNKGPGFKFRLGGGEVIKAWDIGVAGMKVGGKRKIICPPHTAYGAKGSPPAIPPSSTLVFTVELKKVN